MKYIFAGDRGISVDILNFMISKGYKPLALFVSSDVKQSHANELIKISGLTPNKIFKGKEVNDNKALDIIESLKVDYIIGIHFPYIISKKLLDIPKIGFLNLHPAYLPFNKGWHTPSWAIIEGTFYGATLHFMSEKLDAGDIIYQEKVEVTKGDTANSLYQKVLKKEFEVFEKSFETLLSLNPTRIKQLEQGTSHVKKDLKSIQEIDLNKIYKGEELINLLRGLTTNSIEESAYFVEAGKKYYIQVNIIED
ncbi:formyltransferase family protein [uncultured Tenacibaculum sp.]|uniref:methionyl-tRNA formyltransferase n=1 Tax=uncultured Tenacibaculum sp. TaxID=174713 RepID=UPI00262A33F7|nr:formyltransferase family protein [uncultured Tenacibaculum sp.]